ncbi:hypothetical protein GCM10010912_10880 [Paenibacillus albidus]|uniref:Leucine-rich repeat domain-containing protein n=1 Tax=Paenibacillus albidus TaxID=2041023 RepID=A0A917FCD9_9BACL|nr:hypothetical protein [Paenibacillus albidus]GGF67711.1 hypothetical protein GCM10010912_10880 [Paenibacillus albidus]
MGEEWVHSMSGVPWTSAKMNKAVQKLRHRATIGFAYETDHADDLVKLDERVFAKRPDLILHVWATGKKGGYSEEFMELLAGLKHVKALQLDFRKEQDLSKLEALNRIEFLRLHTAKPLNLDFIRAYKQLRFLELRGGFVDLTPLADCIHLDTLILGCTVKQLEFARNLPLIYLMLDNCKITCPLDALAGSKLKMLSLSSIPNLIDISELGEFRELAYLSLTLSKVKQLCDFSKLVNLRELELKYMKSLESVASIWAADRLEQLVLSEINTGIKAEAFAGLAQMQNLRQVDFQFIDFNKGRIAAMRKHMQEAGKEHLLYENIPEDKRLKSMAIMHLSSILM